MSRPLSHAVMAVSWTLAASIHLAASVTIIEFPPFGIQQNIGQYDSEVLFAIGQTRFYGDRVRINPNLTIRFVVAVPLASDFGVLSADGSGVGLAAALNQDGTLNSPDNPAKWESVVSIFGTGPPQAQNPVSVSGFDISLSGPVSYEYVGPAPGSVPGVTQVNLRLPRNVFNVPAGWLLIRPALAGNFHPPMMIFVGP